MGILTGVINLLGSFVVKLVPHDTPELTFKDEQEEQLTISEDEPTGFQLFTNLLIRGKKT
jgi:hypothetical protein